MPAASVEEEVVTSELVEVVPASSVEEEEGEDEDEE